MNNPLHFNIALGRTKPENIRHSERACPFCDVDHLQNILAKDGSIIWLMNKYPVLEKTWPTVIIETDDCYSEFSRFSPKEAAHVIDFSLEKWEDTMARKEFKSVLYFKNYGPMSGGSLRHPHSQIIGLYDYDYREDIHEEHFDGPLISEDNDMRITISDRPLIGFTEFNIRFLPDISRDVLSRRIQQILRYLLNDFGHRIGSYNLFFYDLRNKYRYVKIVPRYLTSPLFIGYAIPQIANDERVYHIISELRTYLK